MCYTFSVFLNVKNIKEIYQLLSAFTPGETPDFCKPSSVSLEKTR